MKPAADNSPYHYQQSVLTVLGLGWDAAIFHPPCTRIANSGVLRLYRGGKKVNGIDPVKWAEMERGAEFFLSLWRCRIPRLCVENPIPHGHAGLPDFTQSIQPYEFGDDASKRTCLWLRELPPLKPLPKSEWAKPRRVCKCGATYRPHEEPYPVSCPSCGASRSFSKPRWSNQTNSGQNKLAPSPERGAIRAVTYDGIAKAMAEQWCCLPQIILPLPA